MSLSHPLLPAAGLVAVTATVWVRMYVDRLGEIRRRRISPQQLATAKQAGAMLEKVQAADNFRNLFEVPVLFYTFCLAIYLSGESNALTVAGSWSYVVLRAAHSYIHCTRNDVRLRFAVYVLSTVLLFALWAVLAIALARADFP